MNKILDSATHITIYATRITFLLQPIFSDWVIISYFHLLLIPTLTEKKRLTIMFQLN